MTVCPTVRVLVRPFVRPFESDVSIVFLKVSLKWIWRVRDRNSVPGMQFNDLSGPILGYREDF